MIGENRIVLSGEAGSGVKMVLDPESFRWCDWLSCDSGCGRGSDEPAEFASALSEIELADRLEDLAELCWLLARAREAIALYRGAFPNGPFEREMSDAFERQADRLEERIASSEKKPDLCEWNDYLALKYDIRTLYKQAGAVVGGSDWRSPCKKLADSAFEPSSSGVPAETGFVQEEQNTYARSYGSEAVKAYEDAVAEAFFPMSVEARGRSLCFLTSSGMKALELALFAYRQFTGERLPFYAQEGFYGEGIELASVVCRGLRMATADEIVRKIEKSEPVGGLLVDPGVCWPARPAVDLDRLLRALLCHRQKEPLFIIVDRTLTSIANPLFRRFADALPPHVVLIAVESGMKYLQFGLEMDNVGFLAATGRSLQEQARRTEWEELLAMLDAGADPMTVRQLPPPDVILAKKRLARVNRNAWWMDGFLRFLAEEGKVADYRRSVEPSSAYMLGCQPWIGAIFYIRLPGLDTEEQYQRWIDDFVRAAPDDEHFVSGGSFGFDTFRMNAVTDPKTGKPNALRVSVGREPLEHFLQKLRYLGRRLG